MADPQMTRAAVHAEMVRLGNVKHAEGALRFFKTGPGQYGEGDAFLGIRVPVVRRMAAKYRDLPLKDAIALLQSRWHEERQLALFILVKRYARGTASDREQIFRDYLRLARHVNNWDLVDCSAEHIVGPHLPPRDRRLLKKLAASNDLWERRIAMLATFHYIKRGDFDDALAIARLLLDDTHALIHKAVGWMLREVGNRDRAVEEQFLEKHAPVMPRTMLRYAIEKFPEKRRRYYMELG